MWGEEGVDFGEEGGFNSEVFGAVFLDEVGVEEGGGERGCECYGGMGTRDGGFIGGGAGVVLIEGSEDFRGFGFDGAESFLG